MSEENPKCIFCDARPSDDDCSVEVWEVNGPRYEGRSDRPAYRWVGPPHRALGGKYVPWVRRDYYPPWMRILEEYPTCSLCDEYHRRQDELRRTRFTAQFGIAPKPVGFVIIIAACLIGAGLWVSLLILGLSSVLWGAASAACGFIVGALVWLHGTRRHRNSVRNCAEAVNRIPTIETQIADLERSMGHKPKPESYALEYYLRAQAFLGRPSEDARIRVGRREERPHLPIGPQPPVLQE